MFRECEDKRLKVKISVVGREEARMKGKVALMTEFKSPIQFKHPTSIMHLQVPSRGTIIF